MKDESDGDSKSDWCAWYNHWRMDKETGGLGNLRTSGEYLDDSIIKMGQNTEKNPGDLRRLAVTQTPVEDHQTNEKTSGNQAQQNNKH